MSREKFTSIFNKLVLAAIVAGGMFTLGTQNAGAQAIVVTTPAFSAGSQSYPAGTYEFTLLSQWLLSIRNVNEVSQKFFAVRPEDNSLPESKGSLTFRNADGHKNLEAVYVPGTGRTAELLLHDETGERAKSERSSTSPHTASGKSTAGEQNTTGR